MITNCRLTLWTPFFKKNIPLKYTNAKDIEVNIEILFRNPNTLGSHFENKNSRYLCILLAQKNVWWTDHSPSKQLTVPKSSKQKV